MTSIELAARLIRVFEGLRLVAYPDSGHVPTIGFGHTKDVKPGDTCSFEQAQAWLAEDLAPLIGLVKDRETLEAAALLSFGYNCGAGALAKVLIGKASLGDFTHDRKGNELPGLVARRGLEAALIELGREPGPDQIGMDWLLAHAHTIFHSPITEGPIMILSREALAEAVKGDR